MAKLLLKSGTGQIQELPLKSGLSRVGRNSENDIQIEHASVSSFHCQITCTGDSMVVKDLGSTNGTFVDGKAIQEGLVANGQRLQFGLVEMLVEAPDVQAPAQTIAPQAPAVAVAGRPRLSVRVAQPAAAAESPAPADEPGMPPPLSAPTSAP